MTSGGGHIPLPRVNNLLEWCLIWHFLKKISYYFVECWRRGCIPVTTFLLSSFCLCFLLNTHSGTKMILSPIKHYNNTNTGLSLRWGLSDNESLPWAAVTALFCNKISLGAVKSTPPPSAHPSILAEYRYPERYVCVGLSFSKWENKKCSS